MSYIISSNGVDLIAVTSEFLASGTAVQWSWVKVPEEINVAREANLVNASSAKISNAKKWSDIAKNRGLDARATQINPLEFHID